MGEQDIKTQQDSEKLRAFVRALLDDVQALERMVREQLIESGVRRIGAEQEIFLVDCADRPAPLAMEVLSHLPEGEFTTELGTYNLEANLPPLLLGGDCLSRLEEAVEAAVGRVRVAARAEQARVVLTGILPTLGMEHLSLEYMTPRDRYREINKVLSEIRGTEFQTYIKGLDELQVHHDNVMLEACNTSFQVHFQVGVEEFARFYNLAQAVTGPVLAGAVNSPLLLQHRLWHETRVALFQQSLDVRSRTHAARGERPRVHFGDSWVECSVLEIFKEDITRYRVLLSAELGEPSMELLERGEIPPLTALCLHNGTVYRWNRPCYGVCEGVAHLRIENRALPAGPTIVDEIANAAFYFGLMSGLATRYTDIREELDFDHAKANFMAAARYGLDAQFRWLGGRAVPARELILSELLPIAREGLRASGVANFDVTRFLDVIEARVESQRTGAQWMLDSLAQLSSERSRDARYRAVVRSMSANCAEGRPVHTWPLATLAGGGDWRESFRAVGQFMTTDIFTVHPEDLIDLAASVMEWEHLRHVPVEDDEGRLVGLVSHRGLMRYVGRGGSSAQVEPVAVSAIMKPDPVTIGPETSALEAIEVMRAHKVGCLPVVQDDKLVGIITEHDFIEVARTLLEEQLREG